VGADRNWSSLPLTPIFLPLVHQIARHGGQMKREPLWAIAGRDLELPPLGEALPDRLTGPDGATIVLRRIQRDGREIARLEEAPWPGIYSAEHDGVRRPVLAVNLAASESDLTPVKAEEIPARLGVRRVQVARTREELVQKIQELRVGRPLAELLLWLVLMVGLLEFLFANRVSRRTAARRMRWIVEPSGRLRPATPS